MRGTHDHPGNGHGQATVHVIKSVVAPDGTRIDLRSDTLQDDDLLLIHMGAGSVDRVVDRMVTDFDNYRNLNGEDGLLCVSVFGVTNGVTKDDILATMPQNQYGQARWADIKQLVKQLLPTSITVVNERPQMFKIRDAHFDLVLDVIGESAAEMADAAVPAVTLLLAKFEPRTRKDNA